MPDIVIQAENLGKKYPTSHQAENSRDVALRAQARALRNRRGEFEPNYGIIEMDTCIELMK
jgi:hypothetical protein